MQYPDTLAVDYPIYVCYVFTLRENTIMPKTYSAHCNVDYTVSQKTTLMLHTRFNPHQPISVIFGRDIADRVCYWMVIFIPPLLTNVSALPRETWTRKLSFQYATGMCLLENVAWGALQRGPGGPWPTQNFGWVGHNAFGPTNNWPVCSLVKLV